MTVRGHRSRARSAAAAGDAPTDAPIVIDARATVRRQIGGVERLAREMVARLPTLRPDRYAVLRPRPRLAHRAGHLWEQLALPLAARRAELVYCPANLGPVASTRTVVTIHDLAALRHPEWYGRTYAAYQRALLPRLARRARLVVTVSEFSKGELIDLLGLDPDDIAVVPNGVDERFSPHANSTQAARALNLTRPYVLAVGTRIARKNLGVLEHACERLERLGIELLAVGGERAYMHAGPRASLRELGYVPDRHLPGLYAGAAALAMPSLYEGFGLPCLEAMASGVPVVASNRAALPETCGDAALLVDPLDAAGLAEALVRAATDTATRERLARAGRTRARTLTWQRSAELTDTAIGRLLCAR